jgi:ABC-type nitrate/sulfonate/bicarbonate transport system permease component
MWAGILFLGLIGFLLNALFWVFESFILRWHRGMRATNK